MNLVWGLYLLSLVSGLGFEKSHSITDLNENFFSFEECVKVARYLNSLPFAEKQVGLERGTGLRYICIVKASPGTNL